MCADGSSTGEYVRPQLISMINTSTRHNDSGYGYGVYAVRRRTRGNVSVLRDGRGHDVTRNLRRPYRVKLTGKEPAIIRKRVDKRRGAERLRGEKTKVFGRPMFRDRLTKARSRDNLRDRR